MVRSEGQQSCCYLKRLIRKSRKMSCLPWSVAGELLVMVWKECVCVFMLPVTCKLTQRDYFVSLSHSPEIYFCQIFKFYSDLFCQLATLHNDQNSPLTSVAYDTQDLLISWIDMCLSPFLTFCSHFPKTLHIQLIIKLKEPGTISQRTGQQL